MPLTHSHTEIALAVGDEYFCNDPLPLPLAITMCHSKVNWQVFLAHSLDVG